MLSKIKYTTEINLETSKRLCDDNDARKIICDVDSVVSRIKNQIEEENLKTLFLFTKYFITQYTHFHYLF